MLFSYKEYAENFKKKKSNDFLKGITTIVSGEFFHETKEKLEKHQPDMFSSCNPFPS